ncbi:putative bifunctional diguanylate cyclase/phosphodiesterase [Actinoplanes sp. NPDC051343]|uniref:putative bifunctional diguanylate cyclase/phosphodiesterase n=1 Tax=Actinoplanes sp. NPDC051343 TaxID=3363906 RepID=UPI0037966C67
MSERVVAGGRTAGLIPLLAAAVTTLAVVAWLAGGRPGGTLVGLLGGPIALLAGTVACQRIGSMVMLPRPVRGFWRRYSHAGIVLVIAAVVAVVRHNADPGLSVYVAGPAVLGVLMAMSAYGYLPFGRRGVVAWTRLLIDGATVAVCGALVFWYVVLDLAPANVELATRIGAAAVAVAGLLALVVTGAAATSAERAVDPISLRILAAGPAIGIAAATALVAGGEAGRMWFSPLALPLSALSMAAAAYRQRRMLGRPAAVRSRRSRATHSMPFLAVAATIGLVVTVSLEQMTGRQRGVIIGAVLIAFLVVARQLLGLRENKRLVESMRTQQTELERLAMTDPLTGLANRTRFGNVLAERLDAHQPVTVLLIDIDDFKTINDTMGPALGDQLLYQVAQRLRNNSAVRELPARLGGDEFAVLLSVDEIAAAEGAASRLQQALAEPFTVGEHHLLANASVGVAIAGQGDGADEVLRNADIAMYAAKEAGKAAWVRFEPRMRQEVVNHARLGSELHNAIIRHELFLLYQPVFDIVTGRLHGVEALVRWKHPVRGLVSPGDFIPVAERSGLIVPLGAWVLREACSQLAAWQAEHGDGAIAAINVNVAVRQLREPGFVDEVAAVLSETGLLPRNIVLEVTESSVADGRQVRETLQALHEMGVRLALDDFGTGHSSLSLLRAFPVDVLKLDKSFVDGIADGEDRGRLAVAAAVAQLAEYLQLSAVAEGIESEAQLERLRDMGYRLGQGFFMARPLPAEEAGALMAAPTPVRS